MGLMEQAKIDTHNFLGDLGAFSLRLIFTAPNGDVLETVGQCFDITLMYETEGSNQTGRHISVNVAEQPFTDANYPMRRADGIISFKDHLVTAIYADGTENKFKEFNTVPDKSINVITIHLQRYADNN